MSVSEKLGDEKSHAALFEQSFRVLAAVTQTRDEDIRTALLEHIERESEDGQQVTQKEITSLSGSFEPLDFQKPQRVHAPLIGFIGQPVLVLLPR